MMELNPWLGRLAVFVNLLAYVIIRWPHGIRYRGFQVVDNRTVQAKGRPRVAEALADH
jgi:hypothetical protein